MAYTSTTRCCGTCKYWVGSRKCGAFNTIDFNYNEKGDCGRPSAANIGGGYASNRGACSDW